MWTCIGEYYVVIVLGMKTYYKPMGLYSGGLTIGERFANEIWGVLYSGGLISGGGGGLSEFYGLLGITTHHEASKVSLPQVQNEAY